MNYNEITFQYYPSKVWIQEPLGTLSLQQLLDSIRSPKDSMKEVFKKIEKAAKNGDNKQKDYLKQNFLYYVTPSIFTNGKGRKYTDIVSFNNVMVVEFDKIDFAEELKHYLFNRMTCIIAAFSSPSKTGCKFLVRVKDDIKNVERYKEYFCGLSYYLDQISGYDPACYNCSLPLFLTWDEDILIRPAEETTEWTIRGAKMNAFDENKEIDFEPLEEVDEEIEEKVVERIDYLIDKIEDNAHPQLLGISFLIGGWVSANYINEGVAFDTMNEAIRRNDYMSKNTNGYLTTGKQMFIKGLNHPAEFTN